MASYLITKHVPDLERCRFTAGKSYQIVDQDCYPHDWIVADDNGCLRLIKKPYATPPISGFDRHISWRKVDSPEKQLDWQGACVFLVNAMFFIVIAMIINMTLIN